MEIIFFILVILVTAVIFFLGVFWVIKSILLYISAKETEATVVKRREDGKGLYKIFVEIEDNGEKHVIKGADYLRMSLDDNLKIGDKIIIWYSKKFRICACDRSQNFKFGLLTLIINAPLVLLSVYMVKFLI
ncbi:MAG: DUF3592 domain-containing protein [Ruminiclostridium sp.]|nr:DUF3592 domain-containing protein [Ruminiclostridium sp.]